MNDDRLTLTLLQIIRVNGNSSFLLNQGYTVYSLSKQIDMLKREGYLSIGADKLTITKKGASLFYILNKRLGKRGLYRFLGTDQSYKNTPIPIDEVYVPPIKRKRVRNEKK